MPIKGFNQNPLIILILPVIWFASSILLIAVICMMLLNNTPTNATVLKYALFAARPQVLGASTSSIETGDAESQKVNGIFKKYKCPLYGLGKTFVDEARKNNIPYWLVASIAFQESSCGKNIPIKEGVDETFNAWGWGVWGSNVKHFDSWEHGISVVSKYMGEKFYSQGITDTCEIMRIYTPPSNGSWCRGVNYFGEMIQAYQSP